MEMHAAVEPQRAYTVQWVAKTHGLCTGTVRNLIRAGIVPARRAGDRVLLAPEVALNFLSYLPEAKR